MKRITSNFLSGLRRFLLACLLVLPVVVYAGTEQDQAESEQTETPDLTDIPRLPEPAQDVEEIIQEREEQEDQLDLEDGDYSPEDEYPAVPGCAPLEGDIEALPLIDRAHRTVSRSLCEPAERIDDTLGNGVDTEGQEPDATIPVATTGTTLLKLSFATDFEQARPPESGLGLSASIRLPKAFERVSEVAIRQAERVGWTRALMNNSVEDIHWTARPFLYLATLTDIGLQGIYPFIRVSVPFERSYGNRSGWLLRPETYWRWQDGAGVGAEFRLGYPYVSETGITLRNRIETNERIVEDDNGWLWSHALIFQYQFQENSSVTTRTRLAGKTEPNWQPQSLRSDVRLRRSFWRPWLHAEVEPYLEWLEPNDFAQTPGIIFRLEVQLGDYPLRDAL